MITVTTFPDVQASRLVARTFTLDELEQRLSDPREYAAKSDCPLVKLARFGQSRSPAGSLRHDGNIVEITGIEADYDAGEIAFADAVGALFEHGVEAFVYTSASHTPERPRWRILCPLSHPYPPAERARFVARLNGIFGGALAPESFALSQSYYIGRVAGATYQSARTRGEFIDLLDGLDAGAIFPARNGQSRAERLAEVRSSDPVVARLVERGMVRRSRSDGAVDIVCPFSGEHTTPDVMGDCTYFPAHTGGFARGHFHCLHSHCAERTDADFLRAAGIEPESKHPEGGRAKKSKQTDVHIDGAELLDAVHGFVSRFVAYPSADAAVAHTLWIAHTHLMDCWESTPRIAFLSPEPGSGKTRALEITETLVPRPVEAINATPAYLFRKVSDPEGLPTILYDEIDTLFGPKAKDNEEIRGILNAGHRRGAMAGRCVVRGKIIETEELPAYCAVAMAGLGDLPDTILTRSVVVRMRRRAPTEMVEPYRRRLHAPEGNAIRDLLSLWAEQVAGRINAWPEMPAGVEDRNADVWEALLAVADAAGGEWPARARVSAVTHVTHAMAATPSLGVRLLSDLRLVFGDRDAMFTSEIIKALADLEEAPWGDLRGKPIDARRLARYLDQYGVKKKQVRIGDRVGKGYSREDLHDPWIRYLGDPAIERVTRVTTVTAEAEL